MFGKKKDVEIITIVRVEVVLKNYVDNSELMPDMETHHYFDFNSIEFDDPHKAASNFIFEILDNDRNNDATTLDKNHNFKFKLKIDNFKKYTNVDISVSSYKKEVEVYDTI